MRTLTSILKENKKVLSPHKVTTLSYDLETNDDSNMNQEIKDYLIEHDWNFSVPQMLVIKYTCGERTDKNIETPKTTAWKANINPTQACNEFHAALDAYNSNHMGDKPAKFARGKAFATCDNVYDAIMVE